MSDLIVELLARRPPTADDEPERLRTLLELLNRPDRTVPSIWVGGAHGKSSVIAMMAALFATLDITAGTASGPHLQDLRERLRIAGTVVSPETLREHLTYLEPFLREVDARFRMPLGFEEVVHAMAATLFADAPVDVAVYEGTAGPTSRVDLRVDLGEAAAVVRPDDGHMRVAGEDFAVADRDVAVGGQNLTLRGITATIPDVYLPLHGLHQARNAAVALAVVEEFVGFSGGLDAELIRQAFASIRLPGRLEVVRRPNAASVVLDGAWDRVSAQALADALRDEFTVRHRIAVVGMVADDPVAVLGALAHAVDHLVVTPAPTPDATPVELVAEAARRLDLPVEHAETVDAALAQASGVATAEDAVVVTGSLQIAGAARRVLGLAPADDLLR